ncbi:hypothetical protein [Pseudomonas sp. KNUC1026]|uniref:hypothetical protein n=1 Tax=Pseudomonas sp. KNUC1026 TaxID=2893890 RepID=UPI001F44D6AC|nr:hypothetical protein [Pseudomonas sp. KNUC1026]UFH50504.1 hypothetical protein LN139_04480 [Pseudomonas sp. KNUC1026]
MKTGLAGDELYKVYDSIKGLITSDEGKKLMTEAVQNASAQLLAAANNAQHTLGPRLSQQARALVGHLHSIAMLRYAGLYFTPMTVQLTVGEYLKLLNNTLRPRTEAFIKTLDDNLRKPGQAKVRATVMNAAFTAAISTRSEKLITVTLWTLESAGALNARLAQAGELARNGAMANVRAIGIGLGGLQSGLANSVQELKINASMAQLLARNALWDLQDAVKGYKPGTAPMLLSLGGLWFQQDSLLRNYKALLEVASDERAEALAAVGSATFGVVGMGVEAAGFAVQVARPGWVVGVGKMRQQWARGLRNEVRLSRRWLGWQMLCNMP